MIAITKRRFRLDKRQSEEEDRKPHIRRFPTRALTSWGLAIELSLSQYGRLNVMPWQAMS